MSEKTGQNGSASGPATEPAGPPLPHFGNERDRIPERIGHFKILDLVAAGMALVYKAEQETPHRIVALKIPRGGKLLSEETRRRFMREVELTAGMDHAGIVPVYEAGEIDGVPFYTMPFIEGRSLAQHIEMEKPDMAARLDIFSRLCQVVAALHATGLVHRDLKPENVMLDRHGNIRLLDFGLAKVLADAETFTGDQALLGTLQCMAPEQTQPGKHGDITPAADVYALGMILYWLLTDEFPYSTKGSRDEALRTIREFQPESPGKRKGGISESLDRIVMACLAKSRKLRPQSGGELQKIVRAAMDGKTPLPPLPVDAATSKSSGKLPVAAICVVVLALIVGAVLILRPLILNRRQEPMRPVQQRPALVTEKTPPPVAVKTPARVDVHAPEAIDAMAGGRPVGKADPSVPAKLWPVYEKARAALRDDFSLRGSGAVLVNAAGDAAVRITWRVEGGAEFSKSVEPRGAMVIYVEANRLYTIESVSGGKIIRRTASAGPGEVRYIEMGGTAAKRPPRAR